MIAPAMMIVPDDRHVPKHDQAVAEDADFGAWLIRPIHRNLRNTISALLRQVQHLKVKSKAVDRRIAEQFLCDGPPEEFEAALRIPNIFDAAMPDGGIEQTAQHTSMNARMHAEAGKSRSERSRSNRYICAAGQGFFEP